MKLPISQLKDALLEMIEQLRDAKCEAEKKGLATIDFGEEMTVSVELIAKGGTNAIERVTVSKNGEQVKRDVVPEISEVTEQGEEVATETASGAVTKETSTQKHTQETQNGTSGGDKVITDQEIETG